MRVGSRLQNCVQFSYKQTSFEGLVLRRRLIELWSNEGWPSDPGGGIYYIHFVPKCSHIHPYVSSPLLILQSPNKHALFHFPLTPPTYQSVRHSYINRPWATIVDGSRTGATQVRSWLPAKCLTHIESARETVLCLVGYRDTGRRKTRKTNLGVGARVFFLICLGIVSYPDLIKTIDSVDMKSLKRHCRYCYHMSRFISCSKVSRNLYPAWCTISCLLRLRITQINQTWGLLIFPMIQTKINEYDKRFHESY